MNDNELLQEILKKTILQVNEKLGLDTQQYNSFELSSFAILVARCIENVCEYYVLGDCSLLVYENGDVNKITDKRLVEFSLRNREWQKNFSVVKNTVKVKRLLSMEVQENL